MIESSIKQINPSAKAGGFYYGINVKIWHKGGASRHKTCVSCQIMV